MTITLLITGATGKQGSAVINNLIAQDADVEILAVTRNVHSQSARSLADKSPKIKLVEGNLDDPEELFRVAREKSSGPVYGVFSVQTPTNKTIEERQGKALIDASLNNHIKHFIYSSVDRGGEEWTPMPHFQSKHTIEQHLFSVTRSTPMDYTVLRPVFFMDNIIPGLMGRMTVTALDAYLQGKPIQMIATSDIGFFAAQAFVQPERYRNIALSLAGDEITYAQLQGKMRAKTGKEVPTMWRVVVYAALWFAKDFRAMFKWFYEVGFGADIAALRRMYPGLKDFGAWLDEESEFVRK